MAHADNSTEEDQTDVDVETEIAADRIEAAVSCDVQPRNWPGKDHDVIVVSWDTQMEGVNGYHKASIIDAVYQSNAAVELHTTRDDSRAVVFKLRE